MVNTFLVPTAAATWRRECDVARRTTTTTTDVCSHFVGENVHKYIHIHNRHKVYQKLAELYHLINHHMLYRM